MEQQNQATLWEELSQKIAACAFSKADLRTLCEMLQEASSDAAEEEISHYEPRERPPEQIREEKELLRKGFELKVAVRGIDGETVFGNIPVVFDSPSFPEDVQSLHINSELDLRNLYNWTPRNRFELLLDFTKPELFNLSLLLSEPMPNKSHILVTGLNSLWVHGVYGQVVNFIAKKRTRRRFLHRQSPYRLLLLCGGFPFAFSIAAKLSGIMNTLFGELSGLLHSAAQVYVFFIALNLFRILFDYARWIFPLVEYQDLTGTALKHRVVLGGLILGVLGNFIHDLLKIVPGFLTQNP
ncbi:hypothetical protein C6495_16615 [Candidatus Poribacteria bacterium]|nr:MAG: hypothetical protein C6495_16615 [Candidatus Poribacteria bacterium]